MFLGRGRLHAINTGSMQLHETHKLHVLAALLLIAATAAGISRDAEGAKAPSSLASAMQHGELDQRGDRPFVC